MQRKVQVQNPPRKKPFRMWIEIDPALRPLLEKLADSDKRSMKAQAEFIIEQAVRSADKQMAEAA